VREERKMLVLTTLPLTSSARRYGGGPMLTVGIGTYFPMPTVFFAACPF
jgi:hypothetical protein